jgi:hypothetical protein
MDRPPKWFSASSKIQSSPFSCRRVAAPKPVGPGANNDVLFMVHLVFRLAWVGHRNYGSQDGGSTPWSANHLRRNDRSRASFSRWVCLVFQRSAGEAKGMRTPPYFTPLHHGNRIRISYSARRPHQVHGNFIVNPHNNLLCNIRVLNLPAGPVRKAFKSFFIFWSHSPVNCQRGDQHPRSFGPVHTRTWQDHQSRWSARVSHSGWCRSTEDHPRRGDVLNRWMILRHPSCVRLFMGAVAINTLFPIAQLKVPIGTHSQESSSTLKVHPQILSVAQPLWPVHHPIAHWFREQSYS